MAPTIEIVGLLACLLSLRQAGLATQPSSLLWMRLELNASRRRSISGDPDEALKTQVDDALDERLATECGVGKHINVPVPLKDFQWKSASMAGEGWPLPRQIRNNSLEVSESAWAP